MRESSAVQCGPGGGREERGWTRGKGGRLDRARVFSSLFLLINVLVTLQELSRDDACVGNLNS